MIEILIQNEDYKYLVVEILETSDAVNTFWRFQNTVEVFETSRGFYKLQDIIDFCKDYNWRFVALIGKSRFYFS